MDYKRIKRLFYAYTFFDDFILVYPIYGILFSDRGLNATQISSLFIAWSVTSFLMEVPAGSIADKYSRRSVLLVAVLFKALGFSSWLLFQNYYGFLLGFILWGINGSLVSGTEEALVYDELKRSGRLKDYTKFTGAMGGLRLLALTSASFLASPLAHLGYTPILGLSVISVLLAGIPILLLPKVGRAETVAELQYLSHIKEGFKFVLGNKKLLFLIAYAAIIIGFNTDEYYSLFFSEKGFSLGAVALIIGFLGATGAITSALAHRLEGKKMKFTWLALLMASTLALATVVPRAVSPLFIALVDAYILVVWVLFNARLQHELQDSHRATVTSVYVLVVEIFVLLTYGVFALVAQMHTYTYGLRVIAILIATFSLVHAVLSRRHSIEL